MKATFKGNADYVATGVNILRHCLRVFDTAEVKSLPDWADTYRVVSKKSSANPGQWRTSRVEVARGAMLAVDEPGVEMISLMVCTQLMKTAFMENVIGRIIHVDPGPTLVIYPNDDAAEAFSKERLAPMIMDTPVLRNLVGDPRGRKSENTIQVKHFPGGFVAMVSAGSPMNLAARPVRYVLSDEIDKYAPTKEGDPILLGEERASTFDEKGISLKIRACSPTTEETSRIYISYLASDQRRPYLMCPHCRHWQYLEFFRHVHWPKVAGRHETDEAHVHCEKCNKPWSERERLDALKKVRWFQTRTFHCCGEGQDPRINRNWDYVAERGVGYALCSKCGKRAVSNGHAGFTASKLYSPYISVPKLAAKWIEAEKDPESKQTFYNTQLALPYKIEATKIVDASQISKRREEWGRVIPNGVVVITAGIDVQPSSDDRVGRLECEVVGWSEYEESWSIAYEVFTGDPAQREVWEELDALLLRVWERQDQQKLRLMAACVDSGGHNTEEVYKFCVARAGRNVWAIKGASDRMGQWSPVWPAPQGRRTKNRNKNPRRPVKIIGVNAAKEAIRQRLLITEPGPGFCHFPAGRPAGYFDQLTAERLIIERKGGMMIRRWDLQSHRSNEALDTRVYAYAALQGLINERGFKPTRVAAILSANAQAAEEGEPVPAPIPARVIEQPATVPPPPAAIKQVAVRRRRFASNFMQTRRW